MYLEAQHTTALRNSVFARSVNIERDRQLRSGHVNNIVGIRFMMVTTVAMQPVVSRLCQLAYVPPWENHDLRPAQQTAAQSVEHILQ